MHAFKFDLMTWLVIAVVLGVGVTMALSHTATADQMHSAAPSVHAQYQMHASSNAVHTQFIKAAEPVVAKKSQSRI